MATTPSGTAAELAFDLARLEAIGMNRETAPMAETGPGSCIVLTTSGHGTFDGGLRWVWRCEVDVDVKVPVEEADAFVQETERLMARVRAAMAAQTRLLVKYGIAEP